MKNNIPEDFRILWKPEALSLHQQKVYLKLTKQIDWFTSRQEGYFKIFVQDDNIFIMKPRARSKGWLFDVFDEVYIKNE